MLPCLTLRSKVSEAIQGKEWLPTLHHGVVAIEKGTFGSLSTTVTNFTYFYWLS